MTNTEMPIPQPNPVTEQVMPDAMNIAQMAPDAFAAAGPTPADTEAQSRFDTMKAAIGNVADAIKGAGADTREMAAEFWNQHGATVTQIGKGALTGAGIELRSQIQNQEPDTNKILKSVLKSGAKSAGATIVANKGASIAAGKGATKVGGSFARSYQGRRTEQRRPVPDQDTDSDEFAVAA